MTHQIAIDSIVADDDCQLRAAGSDATISEYAEALTAGAIFPPVIAFSDGEHYFPADGFHRLEAHRIAGIAEIRVEVREGDRRDAKLFAAGANADHGLRRTQADKRKVIETLLSDPEWRTWSDKEIARRTATSDKTVGKVRRELSGEGVNAEIRVEERTFTTRHGTEAKRRVEPTGMMERVLQGLPDGVLIAEVQRRGLMEAARHE